MEKMSDTKGPGSDPLRCKVGLRPRRTWVPRCGQGEVERRWHNPQSLPLLMLGHCRPSSLSSFSGRTCPSTRVSLRVDPLCTDALMTYAVDLIFLCAFFFFLTVLFLFPFLGCSLVWYGRSALGRSCEARGLMATKHKQLKGSIARPLGDGCFSRGGAHCHLRIRALCSDCSTKTRWMHIYFCNLVGIPF